MRSAGAGSERLVQIERWPFAAIWSAWMAVSTVSVVTAIFASILVISAFSLNEDRVMAPILLVIWFVLMAGGQTWILSARLRHAGWWPIACAVGWLSLAPAVWVAQTLSADVTNTLSMASTILIVGVMSGIAQWLVLRGHWNRAMLWPVASALSSVALALAIAPTITSMPEFVLLGAIPGAIMGLLVAWMFVDLRGTPI